MRLADSVRRRVWIGIIRLGNAGAAELSAWVTEVRRSDERWLDRRRRFLLALA